MRSAVESLALNLPWKRSGEVPQDWFDARKGEFYIELEDIRKTATRLPIVLSDRFNCVYFLFDGDELAYVGRSNCLEYRLKKHAEDKRFDSVAFIECPDLFVDCLEIHYIKKFKPRLNIRGVNL
jgi:hypothetical protein